jgi:ornithine cyclodeaminase
MTMVVDLPRIEEALKGLDPVAAIADGFVAYSRGRVVVPPPGELIFRDPPGDAHIKYGFIEGDDVYVVKIASGFYRNAALGLPANSGLMLMFSQKTGALDCILLDEGHLTNVRTAAAGAVAAKALAPSRVERIGVFGTGVQGRMQLEYTAPLVDCRKVMVWGRRDDALAAYKDHMGALGFDVETTHDAGAVAAACNLIITATPATSPLLRHGEVRPGTHITAMGSDTPDKNEIDPAILGRADVVVADSISQCLERGEIFHAIEAGTLARDRLVELGNVIADPSLGRISDSQITVADLTGVAIQDIQISKAVYRALVT